MFRLVAPLLAVFVLAAGFAVAQAPATEGKPADGPLEIFRLRPSADDAASVKTALAVLDDEIARLEEANARRKGGVREANQERIDDIKVRRKELASGFSAAKWQAMVRDVFQAMEVDRVGNAKLDDTTLWNLSQNPAFVNAGKSTVMFNCVPCHLPSLRGKGESSEAFAPDLTDHHWIHGGRPSEVLQFITHGKPQIGMPGWGDIIGSKKVAEVAAYVLSKHQEGEPIYQQASNVPVATE
jgi:hypothetical protein